MNVAGVILAGGRSSRMGGRDKALIQLGAKPLLAHVLDRLRPHLAMIALNSNADPALFASSGLDVLADRSDDRPGPLAGLLAAMEWAASKGATHVLVTPADTPFIPDDLVASFSAATTPERPVVLAASNGARHPVTGLWPVTLREPLARFIVEDDKRRVTTFADRHGAQTLDFPLVATAGGEPYDPFFNVNTPDDLAAAEAILRRINPPSQRVFGITGWKNSGKTTLTERLVAELTARGWRVSTIKHAHHEFDIDKPGADSFRHRQAGASEVAIVSGRRWALMHELRDENEPRLDEILARMSPCDLIVVEGYKREDHLKIECRRLGAKDTASLAVSDARIVAVAADHDAAGETIPVFDLDDVPAIASFVERVTGLAG